MPTQTHPIVTPQTPTIAPAPEALPWPQRFTDPLHICPQQKRELGSPDIEP